MKVVWKEEMKDEPLDTKMAVVLVVWMDENLDELLDDS
jgi:hypothetical protein